MSIPVVLGESPCVDAWALAGADVVAVESAAAAAAAWDALPPDTEIVIVTPSVALALGARLAERLSVVLP